MLLDLGELAAGKRCEPTEEGPGEGLASLSFPPSRGGAVDRAARKDQTGRPQSLGAIIQEVVPFKCGIVSGSQQPLASQIFGVWGF